MKKMSPLLLAGFIAGWLATALLGGYIAIRFATPAQSAAAQPPAQPANLLLAQATVPTPPAPTPAIPAPAAPTPVIPTPAAPPPPGVLSAAQLPAAQMQATPVTPAFPAAPAAAAPVAAAPAAAVAPAAPVAAAPAAAAAPALSNPAPAPSAPAVPAAPVAPPARISNATLTEGTADQGLILKLRGVNVDQALTFLSESAGFTIIRETATSGVGVVDLESDTPLDKDGIVAAFNKVLADHGLAAVRDGKMLNIMTVDQAVANAGTPVNFVTNYTQVPDDAEMVTWVIPVHTLDPKQVLTDLYSLIPPGAVMNYSVAGTSVIMTGRQMDVRRFAQIISLLDSTGNGDLQVFLLKYADSKALAAELKEVFTADTGGTQGNNNPFAAFVGGRGGRSGGGGGGGTDAERRTGIKINAVSDDENNAVLVSAPTDFMPGISNIIIALDIPQEDSVQIQLFFLTNADCTDVATELLSLFPDPNQSSAGNANAGRRGAPQMRGGGGAAAAGSSMSDRLKKQVTVNAVPDPRTQSVLVTASNDTMAQIEKVITKLDEDTRGHVEVYIYKPMYANAMDLQSPMTDLFQQNGRSSSASTQMNALALRIQTGAQQSGVNASTTIGTSSGGGGARGN